MPQSTRTLLNLKWTICAMLGVASLLVACNSAEETVNPTTGGQPHLGGRTSETGGSAPTSTGGSTPAVGGITQGGKTETGGTTEIGGVDGSTEHPDGGSATGGRTTGGTMGGNTGSGGTASGQDASPRDTARGGVTSNGGTANGGTPQLGGKTATGGTTTTGGRSSFPCDGSTNGYNTLMIQSGSTWTVTQAGVEKYTGTDTTAALTAAYNSLTEGRTTKQSILVQGNGDIPASSQVPMPSYIVLNWCGTLNVSGTPTGTDRSPFFARSKTDVHIPNLKMTGSPQYGIFFRGTNQMHLGRIDLKLTSAAGIGIRVDTSGSAGKDTTFVSNLTIDHVSGGGMSSQLVETYGVDKIKIGTIEGDGVGECGLLLNRSINAEIGTVTCNNCGTGTGYAAFRVANSVGKINGSFPAGNIHVGKVYARGGGRGIFSVSGSGGLTIDTIDIANTGNTSILLQNTYNTTIAAISGTVVGGLVQISNDTTNTNNGTYPPSQNVAIKNLVLSGGASVRQDWCEQPGRNGCSATNIKGGTVTMCP